MEPKNRFLSLLVLPVLLALAVSPLLAQASQGEPNPSPKLQVILEISGGGSPMTIGGFQSVSGLDSETDVIEFREGGDPGVIRKLPGRTKYANIVLKRGILDDAQNDLWNWRSNIIQGIPDRRDGAVILMSKDGSELIRYEFFEAFPAAWKGFSVDQDGSEISVEELVLAVERIERIQ